MDTIRAPWTVEQVANLQRWQISEVTHSYTCGDCGRDLLPTPSGWHCSAAYCTYKQDWAMDWDTSGLPLTFSEMMDGLKEN